MNQDDYVQPMIEITQVEYGSLLQTETRMQMVNQYIDIKDLESAKRYGCKDFACTDGIIRMLLDHEDTNAVNEALFQYEENNKKGVTK